MDRRWRRSFVLALSLAASITPVRLSHAAPKDAAASKLADEAINRDYLSTNFAEAEKKLRSAIAMCGGGACIPIVRGRLHRDLGVVLIAGLNREGEGKQEFLEALRSDPDVALEKDLTTPEIEAAFKAVKAGGVPAAKPSATAAPSGGGDIVHTPANEQLSMTAMPIYVEIPDGVVTVKVIARYKPFGTPDWKTLELRRLGSGYGAEVPCGDVGSTTGDFTYYVQATDAAGDVVATSGTRAAPNKVPVRNDLTGEAPHLPGRPPASRCHESADCPPGLPGCGSSKKITSGRGWGATCEDDRGCGAGLWCKRGACESGVRTEDADEPKASGKYCDSSLECETGEKCSAERVCERAPEKAKKIWLSLNAGQDFAFVGTQPNVCGTEKDLAAHAYDCRDETGGTYEGIPANGGPDTGNGINGGVGPATTRIMAGLEYLVGDNVTLGGRLGYALRTGPNRSLAAFHAEARIGFWFGREPFSRHGVRPYLVLVGGLAEVHNKFNVQVIETQPDAATYPTTTLTVWRHSGSAFAGGGLGLMIPTSGAGQGFTAEAKVVALFPDAGVAMTPSIGYALGL